MNVTNLKSDIDFLCGSTSASYPDADKIRNINIAYNDVARLIWESDGTWAYDDANNTDTPIAYRTVANASASYQIPTSVVRVKQFEIKDNDGNWFKLKPITYDDLSISPEEYMTSAGLPLYYLLDGTQVRLFPAPGTGYVTMTSGLAVRLDRNVTEFATTASTETPGFPTSFHRILSYAAAVDFIQDDQQKKFLLQQKARLENGLVRFYGQRSNELRTQIKPHSKRRWRQYL